MADNDVLAIDGGAGAPGLDPEIRAAVRDIPDFVFSAETVPIMRENAVFAPVDSPDIERIELTAGPDGGLHMTLLRPRDAVGDLPVLYWMHGGGTVIGNRFMDNDRLNEWCRSLSCVCVSVEYRLAPEAPYPAAIDDCDEGLRYIFDHAAELRLDTHRIGLAGRSAGGGLAAALALRWRDRGDDRAAFQYLEYPMLDDRMNTPSSMLDGLPLWSRESNAFGWRSYLGDRCGTDSVPPDAAPGRASELAGLPSTFITVGTADCLRDEAIDFAARLCQAGVLTELHVYAGAVHGFDMFADCTVVRCAARDSADWLARQFR
jgi:acetyl esterase/lipase